MLHQKVPIFRKQSLHADFIILRPKSFTVTQCALSTCCKIAVQIADTACLQIGGFCWYPSEGTFVITYEITFEITFATERTI